MCESLITIDPNIYTVLRDGCRKFLSLSYLTLSHIRISKSQQRCFHIERKEFSDCDKLLLLTMPWMFLWSAKINYVLFCKRFSCLFYNLTFWDLTTHSRFFNVDRCTFWVNSTNNHNSFNSWVKSWTWAKMTQISSFSFSNAFLSIGLFDTLEVIK